MRIAIVVLMVAAAGCSFDPHGAANGDGDGGDGGSAIDAAELDAPVDTPIDAAFDLTRCPSIYTIEIGRSRYRIRPDGDSYATHYDNCADDTPERLTHLVVLSDPTERDALRAHPSVCDTGGDCDTFWTGVFAVDGTSFVTATGEAVVAQWDTGEPTDFDEPRTAMTYNPFTGFNVDQSIDTGITSVRSLCECDGRAAVALPPER